MRFRDYALWPHGAAIFLAAISLLTPGSVAAQRTSNTLRDDRISLDGTWRFQLRRDNQLAGAGVVKFGPLTASSQALTRGPAPGENRYLRFNLGMPWGLAVTLAGPAIAPDPAQAIWKPHPQQQGATWWQADMANTRTLDSVRVHWAKPGEVEVRAEVSDDGARWADWTSSKSKAADLETTLVGAPTEARFVKLTFLPAQLAGTRKIEIRLKDSEGRIALWQPSVRKTWFDDLRRFTPSDGFELASFDESDWNSIRVPGYWEAQGYGHADWFEPNDEVGYYRRAFNVPEAWRGRAIRLRFEGANHGAQVWVNGQEVGYHEGGFTPFEYDVTPLVNFGASNLVAVRVAKLTLTSEFETDDAFYLGGLWRDVCLYSLPADHIEDFEVRTELDRDYENAVLKVQLKLRAGGPENARSCVVAGTLFDAVGNQVPLENFETRLTLAGRQAIPAALAALVKTPHKWTAETPYLYTLLLRLSVEGRTVQEIRSTVGFRKVEVKGMRLLVNGVPVELRGVVTIRANPNDSRENPDALFAREIRLLKEGNINAARSHTAPLEEQFLTLCDRYGIYVMPDVPYVWVLENDFRYLTGDVVQRAREIFAAHKNHPSVILWHVGNENAPTTAYLGGGQASRWLRAHDPTRPVAVCRNLADNQELGTQISDLHYDPMTYPEFRELYPHPLIFGEFHAVPNEIARLEDKGFVETWGRSLQQEWSAFLDRTYDVAGGFICCWEDGALNGDLGFNQWGVVDSQHQAKPVYYEIRKAFAPLGLTLEEPILSGGRLKATLKIINRYNFTNLDGFAFRWKLSNGAMEVSSGEEALQVRAGMTFFFPLSFPARGRADRLQISILDDAGNTTQEEEFLLPDSSAPLAAKDLLKELGVAETSALGFDFSTNEVRSRNYRAAWGQGSAIHIQDPSGRDFVTLNGLAMEAEETSWSNLLSGTVQYQPAQKQAEALRIPFTVTGETKDKKQTWRLPGSMRIEFGEAWIRVSYTLIPSQEVAIPEAGIRLLLARQFLRLSWNRDALWSVPPEGWTDHSLEMHVSLQTLRRTISKRNVFWASVEGDKETLLFVPLGISTNLRKGNSPGEIVLSDFLSAGNFLGKFDKDTAQRTLRRGDAFQGGFVIYFLTEPQRAKLTSLEDSKKDLTWSRRAKVITTH